MQLISAKSAVTQIIHSIWLEEIPPFIYDVVCMKLGIPFS
jgi:hypothetical protein